MWTGSSLMDENSLRGGKREVEGGAPVLFGLDPNPAAVPLNDPLADGQTDAGSRNVPPVQALEYAKDLLVKLRFDANPVVANRQAPRAVHNGGRDVHARRLLASIFEGVSDQVLKSLDEVRLVPFYGRQRIAGDARVGFFDSRAAVLQRFAKRGAEVDRRDRRLLSLADEPGIGQQAGQELLHPRGAVGDEANASGSFLADRPRITLDEQLGVGGDHAQGFLQIVTRSERKVAEVFVGARQPLVGFAQPLLLLHLLGDVADYGDPPVDKLIRGAGRDVGSVNPAIPRAEKVDFRCVLDPLAGKDALHIGADLFETLRSDDLPNGSAGDVALRLSEPAGIGAARPKVTEIPAAARNCRGHVAGNGFQLLLVFPQLFLHPPRILEQAEGSLALIEEAEGLHGLMGSGSEPSQAFQQPQVLRIKSAVRAMSDGPNGPHGLAAHEKRNEQAFFRQRRGFGQIRVAAFPMGEQ